MTELFNPIRSMLEGIEDDLFEIDTNKK